ncbi:hypothetical protein RHMOL_Rhmol01G0056000 [Rhododendron molle]|uniref:Uncharacterized protein n=1 Tax=Rhododendron molle TaxID=49168 RepID=A0ACC0PZU7_RHOML|nr:hypothetical protein RHMOL_Rhmol01G0056000 [Rhododendron molle]
MIKQGHRPLRITLTAIYIINDAKDLINRTGTTLTHIFREANQCADHPDCFTFPFP